MDMYQKRKMRKEKREQNSEGDNSFTSSRIHWDRQIYVPNALSAYK